MKYRLMILPLLILILLLASCAAPVAAPTAPPVPEATVIPATASPTTAPATATPEPTTPPTPAPEASPTLNPLMATMEAMKKKVTVVPATPVGGGKASIAPDDYVGMTQLACNIVKENYVRGNFNGADWDAVCKEYLEKARQLKDHEAFWDMMTDMIAELNDDHSRFVRPDRFAAEFDLPSEDSGKPWPGMTVWPAREDEYLFIWDVCEEGGAADAGLHRGDIITAIEGEEVVKGEDGFQRELIHKIYQGDGEVTLTVWQGPDEDPHDVTVTYGGAAGCDGWFYAAISDDPYIGYLRVPEYGGNAEANILDMIETLEKERPLDGLIYDERHNPGGNSDAAIAIFTTGVFGKVGKLRDDAIRTIWRIRGPVKWNETTPMAVLTDGASHSAAEYFATAMKQSGRATLVGMPTAGNTEGITGFTLPDGSIIRLAVETLILPDGKTMEGTGGIPDVKVPLGQWGLRQTPDVQLQKAIEVVNEKIAGK
jgi:C-terminal processing protease CtpA/Prc